MTIGAVRLQGHPYFENLKTVKMRRYDISFRVYGNYDHPLTTAYMALIRNIRLFHKYQGKYAHFRK